MTALPEGLTLIDSPLPGIKVDTPAASGLIYFNGAHVAEWTPAGERPVLWLSDSSLYEAGKAIRGGVPLVFPWFGGGASGGLKPQHGFARLQNWNLKHAKVSSSGVAKIQLALGGAEVDRDLSGNMPRDYNLEMHITMGRTLILQLIVTAGDAPIRFEQGLHSYFAVGDINQVSVEGVDGAAYEDRVTGHNGTQQGAVRFTGETDRVYESRQFLARILDPVWDRTIQIEKVGSAQTVIWNPWIDKSKAMADFGDDEWTGMVCVEAVNTREQAVVLGRRKTHLMSQTISIHH